MKGKRDKTQGIYQCWSILRVKLGIREIVLVRRWRETDVSAARFWCLHFVLPVTSRWIDKRKDGRRKRWLSWICPEYQLTSHSPWRACEALNETSIGFAFLFLDVGFVFRLVILWACIKPCPSFWWTPKTSQFEMKPLLAGRCKAYVRVAFYF